MATTEITLEQALELIEPRLVRKDGNVYVKVDDLRELKKEFAAMAEKEKEKEPEETPKTMDQAKMLAVHRISEANLKTPTGNEAVKS